MRIQFHFEIKEEDGRLWYKRYFVDNFPALPHLYNVIEAKSILGGIEPDEDVLNNLDGKVYYVIQIVWYKDDQGFYPLLVCVEREENNPA